MDCIDVLIICEQEVCLHGVVGFSVIGCVCCMDDYLGLCYKESGGK